MDQAHHDRNLLFGILALQMDFISREALVTAMNAWVLAKEKSLGEILLQQGALPQGRRELLEALVQEHLKQHDNDPQQSLAAVSSIGSVEEDLKQLGDGDVNATLAFVGTARPERSLGEKTTTVGSSTSAGMRFRILRPYAEGGLGTVSVARDEELSREVALKEIKARQADNPDSRARFVLEAEITGGLEHPGIVPVYGLGQYADGRPFYAMRFIRGDSLQEAVDRYHDPQAGKSVAGERAVELRKLLGRFLDVCNAIAYAHSRGILHRDLKPGNIMLGQYGETLVVDWGLAKAVDRPELTIASSEGLLRPSSGSGSATQMGAALGTPQYMSPEQAAGRLDLLGPASDVYSLGATLYYVLTGRSPIQADDVGTVLKKVQSGEFRPPRAVNPQIARPLEAICLKAMALAPADRYGSPKALADDIEHWLADEPVTAYRERWPGRAARWARKHKSLVLGAFGLVLAASIALAVSTLLIRRQQVLTEAARQQSERSFQVSRDAINELCNEVASDVLLSVPGVQPVREKLLQKAKKYYEKLRELNNAARATGRDLAATNYRLARIYELLGKNDDARSAYEDARQSQEVLYQQSPNDPALLEDLGDTLNALAAFEQNQKCLAKAAELYERAIEVRKKLADLSPEKARLLANTLMNRGLLNKDRLSAPVADGPQRAIRSEVYRSALRDFDEAQQIRGRLLKQYPNDCALQRDTAQGDCNLAGLEMAAGLVEPALALQHCNEARKSAESAVGRFRAALDTVPDPGREAVNRLDLQCDLLASQRLLADLQIFCHRPDASPDLYEGIVNELTTLAARSPNVPRFRAELAIALQHQGNTVMSQTGEKAAKEALKSYRRSEEIVQQLVRDYPDKSAYRDALAKIHGKIREAEARRDGHTGPPPEKSPRPSGVTPPG